jgi:hypothetical protein
MAAVLYYRNLLRFRFRLFFGFGSGSDSCSGSAPVPALVPEPDITYQSFPETKKIAQNLGFSMSEAAYLPESWPFIYDFLTFLLHFMLDPDPES